MELESFDVENNIEEDI